QGGHGTPAAQLAGRHNRTDVPSGICGRRSPKNGDAAAGLPAKRGGNPDRHGNTKSCRFSGDSPDRLCLLGQHGMRSESSVRYSIVVPFYNEQENIPPLYMKITEVMDSI